MDQQYKTALNQAENLEHRVRDLIDDKNHPAARSLLSASTRIVDELETKKNPRSIENTIKSTMQLIHHARSQGEQTMNFPDLDFLHKNYEHLMMSLRQFDNY